MSAAEEYLAAKNAKSAKKWKAVTERPRRAGVRKPPEKISRKVREVRKVIKNEREAFN